MDKKKLNKIGEWIGYGLGIILILWIFKVIIPYVITGAIAVFIWKFMTGSGNKSSRGSSRKKSGPTWVERSINPNYMRNEDDAEAERQRRIRDRRDDERRRQWDEDWAAKRAADRLWDEQHH
ncbi:hypothetical protein [uncultured Lacticaseibacillus sp.]|uniref:hypothetical protein n=1 Tax=uncultured Lacticaseibacillus sp. TaxID=2775882 RepID=UPI002592594F|nr:hypothetical protein [uncultured Lacticaseibacillus sp.]